MFQFKASSEELLYSLERITMTKQFRVHDANEVRLVRLGLIFSIPAFDRYQCFACRKRRVTCITSLLNVEMLVYPRLFPVRDRVFLRIAGYVCERLVSRMRC